MPKNVMVMFLDDLPEEFIAFYKIPATRRQIRSLRDPELLSRMAENFFEAQLSADQVAGILTEIGAPTPWVNPTACVGVGTILCGELGPHAARAQAAFEELNITLSDLLEDWEKCLAMLSTKFKRAPFYRELLQDFCGKQNEIKRFRRLLENAPAAFTERKIYNAPVWHVSAAVLLTRYVRIVGQGSISPNGPAVRFVQKMLAQLNAAHVTLQAIENVFRRGISDPDAPGKNLVFDRDWLAGKRTSLATGK